MTDDAARTRVAERLASLQVVDERLVQSLAAVAAGASGIPQTAIDRAPVETLTTVIAALREPLPAAPVALSSAGARSSRPRLDAAMDPAPPSAGASAAVQAAYDAVGAASGAAAALFTTGRLMFEAAVCDFAGARMETYAQVTNALNALLPQVVGWELRESGLPCHCICPMCGLGACGCIWASLHNIDIAWGGPGLPGPDERGIPLRSPPRPGSQLEAAGVRQWERIVSVDAEAVQSVAQLQTALRRHSLGQEVRLRIDRDGESREVVVRHASDLP